MDFIYFSWKSRNWKGKYNFQLLSIVRSLLSIRYFQHKNEAHLFLATLFLILCMYTYNRYKICNSKINFLPYKKVQKKINKINKIWIFTSNKNTISNSIKLLKNCWCICNGLSFVHIAVHAWFPLVILQNREYQTGGSWHIQKNERRLILKVFSNDTQFELIIFSM